MQEKLKRLKEILALLKKYEHALGIMYFDFETIVPKDAREDEAEILDFMRDRLSVRRQACLQVPLRRHAGRSVSRPRSIVG